MYNHYYNDLEGSNRQSTNKNNNNEVTHRSARNSLALKNGFPPHAAAAMTDEWVIGSEESPKMTNTFCSQHDITSA